MTRDVVRELGFLTLGTRLKRIGERLQADAQRIMGDHGGRLHASQYPFMAAIDSLGPLTVGERAEAVGITQPGATRAVTQLVELGFLRAEQFPDDQRRRIISFSEEGRQLVDMAKRQVWPMVESAVRDV